MEIPTPLRSSAARSAQSPALGWLALATGVTLILSVMPFADALTFPIRMFVTFIHEGSHAAAALVSFGSVERMTVAWDGSGVTLTRGGLSPLISSAGYLGTALFGALLLLLAQREARAKLILSLCGALTLALTVFFINGGASTLVTLLLALAALLWLGGMRRGFANPLKWGMLGASALVFLSLAGFWFATGTLFSWIVGLSLAVGLLALGRFSSPRVAHFLVNFLAVQCCLNALIDLKTLFFLSVAHTTHSDAVNMARLTGVPPVVWASLWGGVALALLVVTLWTVVRRSRQATN
jgi:hypothetical protein